MNRGRFITLEGIEGVGKTSAIGLVADWVRERGHEVVVTREPGGTELGEAVRSILLDLRHTATTPMTELLLVFAARAQHLAEVIRPALEAGRWVVSDRFTDATYAYQGGGRGLAAADIAVAENLVQRGFTPDLTLLLDAPPALALGRAHARGSSDRFERERLAFFERARAVYLERAAGEPRRCAVLDASRPLEEVHGALLTVLAEHCA